MQKLIGAFFLVVILAALQAQAFAADLKCQFKDAVVEGVETIKITDESLFINNTMEIPLDKTSIKCGHFRRQTRLDGMALGYQVVLKSCTSDAKLEGHLIDSVKKEIAEVHCN